MTELKTDLDPTFAPAASRVLITADRCDRCVQQAAVALEIKGFELLFCAHDYNEHEAGLAAKGAVVTADRRDEIK